MHLALNRKHQVKGEMPWSQDLFNPCPCPAIAANKGDTAFDLELVALELHFRAIGLVPIRRPDFTIAIGPAALRDHIPDNTLADVFGIDFLACVIKSFAQFAANGFATLLDRYIAEMAVVIGCGFPSAQHRIPRRTGVANRAKAPAIITFLIVFSLLFPILPASLPCRQGSGRITLRLCNSLPESLDHCQHQPRRRIP